MSYNTTLQIGDKFGKLTIIGEKGKNKYNYNLHIVKCECGKEKVFSSACLRKRVCCGCTINKRPANSKNFVGQQIEDLFVKNESHVGRSGHVYYDCECTNCKSIITIASNRLLKIKQDKIKKCKNCIDRSTCTIVDIVGLKVGKLTILKLDRIDDKGTSFWEGICECGNKRVIRKAQINKALRNNIKLCCHKCLKEIHRANFFKNIMGKEFYAKNSIEKKTEDWLKSNNINCKYNFILDGMYQFDFLINNNVLVEVHGDYWHSNPEIYKNGPIYSHQIKHIERDAIKRSYVLEKGYIIYYIWEKDIRNGDFSSLYDLITI